MAQEPKVTTISRKQQAYALLIIGAVLGISAVLLGGMLLNSGISLPNLNFSLGTSTASNNSDINLTTAIKYERMANQTLNESEKAITWAIMGNGNYEAAQAVLKDTGKAYEYVAWAGTNLSKTKSTDRKGPEWSNVYLRIQNDSKRIQSINIKATDVKKPSAKVVYMPAPDTSSSEVSSDSSNTSNPAQAGVSTPKPTGITSGDGKQSAKKNLREGIH